MNSVFQPEWRTQARWKRRFYAKYMTWLERGGYLVVLVVFAAFIFAFNYRVDDVIKADAVPLTFKTWSVAAPPDDQRADYQLVARPGRPVTAGEILYSSAKRTPIVAGIEGVFEKSDRPGDWGQVVDERTIVAEAELQGQTVALADEERPVRLTAFNVSTGSNTLLRASSDRGDIFSSTILSPEAFQEPSRELRESSVKLRDDRQLKVTTPGLLQVDAHAVLEPAESADVALDPPSDFTMPARVTEGQHTGKVQVADLPPAIGDQYREAIRSQVVGRKVRNLDGKTWTIRDLQDVRLVVQLNAMGIDTATQTQLAATAIDRKYVAKIEVPNPPAFLFEALRRARLSGKPVTARVEMVTGARPIAFILLKRS